MIVSKKIFYNVGLLLLLFCVAELKAQKIQQKIPDKTRILFVLDASGSMQAIWEGNTSRMDAAKTILTRLIDSLRNNANLELALRVYGNRYPRQSNNCEDSFLEVPFGSKNHDAIIDHIKEIKPKGTTPITYSLVQAAKDFPTSVGYRNIIILITDGIESCGGDPCQTSVEFQKKGIFLRPFVIGLGLKGSEVLNCVGQFFNTEDTKKLSTTLNDAIETTFKKTTVSVELLDEHNEATETNVNVSFLNSMTGTAAYEFIHYLDSNGKPDSVQVDPVLSYDVVVNTLPRVVRKHVNIDNGKHNVISIAVPQGYLVVNQEGRSRNELTVIVREKNKDEILNTQKGTDVFRYLVGNYEVETLTLPRRIFEVEVKPKKTSTVTLPTPGLANINTTSIGYGSLFEIFADGTQHWVCDLAQNKTQQSLNLLPGTYKIAFRIKATKGSKYTGVKTFKVASGKTVSVTVFN
jgi:Ca-activated chloride channel family protein